MKRCSTRFKVVQEAHRKGYFVLEDGQVTSPWGRTLKLYRTGNPAYQYLAFSIVMPDGRPNPVMVHQLAAYQKFGKTSFSRAACTRHLNGDRLDNRPSNIEIGSVSDNVMDKSSAQRVAQAKRATSFVVRRDWDVIDADRAAGFSYRDLHRKYGVSKGTLSYRYSKKEHKEKTQT